MHAGLDHDCEEMRRQLLELGGVDAYNVLKNINPDAPDALDILLKMEDARKKAVTDVAAADRTRSGSAYDPTAQPSTIQTPPFATDEGGNLVTTYPDLPYYGEIAGYVDCRPLTNPARDEFVDRYDPIDGYPSSTRHGHRHTAGRGGPLSLGAAARGVGVGSVATINRWIAVGRRGAHFLEDADA